MKAFKTKTTEEQKTAYVRSCRRWMNSEIGKLRERHRGALERADKLRHQAVQADYRAEKMQDVMAVERERIVDMYNALIRTVDSSR